MTPTALVIAALILVLGVGLVAWAWFTMDQVEESLRSLGGFERKHFEIGPRGAEYAKGTN